MSLINDALKRARREALRQEAESRGTSYWAVPAHSRRVRVPWWLFVVGGAATVLVLAALVAFWPRSAGPDNEAAVAEERQELAAPALETQPPATSEAEAATAVAAEPSAGTAIPAPEMQTGVTEQVVEEAGAGISAEESVAEQPAVSRPVPAPTALPTEPPDRISERPRRQTPQGEGERLEDGVTYVRRAVAADGSAVELGGIAYSDTRPIAVINGSVVSPGDMIAGFTVVAIEPERVELEADGVRIYLMLR